MQESASNLQCLKKIRIEHWIYYQMCSQSTTQITRLKEHLRFLRYKFERILSVKQHLNLSEFLYIRSLVSRMYASICFVTFIGNENRVVEDLYPLRSLHESLELAESW
jgi:hypothetical protein